MHDKKRLETRQQEKRKKENSLLRKQIDKLLNNARENETKQSLFDKFNLSILATQSPEELLHLLLEKQKDFRADSIHLLLLDNNHEFECLLTNNHNITYPCLSFIKSSAIDLIKHIPKTPLLGSRILENYQWMTTKENLSTYASGAVMPLIRDQAVIGAQLLLSFDENRYNKNDSTDFLAKSATMIAIAIENCINRQQILKLGYQDGLTSAYNRRYFDEHFKQEVYRCHSNNHELVCFFIDIDFFKQINDEYGHQAGDQVLIELVATLHQEVRNSDIVARYGGEEFAIILPETSIDTAHEIAERIRYKISNTIFNIDNNSIRVTISIGMAALSQIKQLIQADKNARRASKLDDRLLGLADKALYQAKQTGRNQVIHKN